MVGIGCLAVERDRKAGLFPGVDAAIEDIGLEPGRHATFDAFRVSAGCAAGLAVKDQDLVARARRMFAIEYRNRMMPRSGDFLARMLVAFADIDQHRAVADQFGGAFGEMGVICVMGLPC